jgi:nitroreductase
MQLWEFHHISSPKILDQMTAACMGQKAASTAKEMVVVVVRKDLWKKRIHSHLSHLKKLFKNKQPEELTSREKFATSYYKKVMPFVYGEFLGIYGYFKFVIAQIIGIFRPIYRQLRKSDIRVVTHKTAGLAAQTFMLAMSEVNYDTCPMEGTDTLRIKKILNLPGGSEINMVISCGIRVPEGIYGKRFRLPFEEVYNHW